MHDDRLRHSRLPRQRQHVLEILQMRHEGMQIAFQHGLAALGQCQQIVPARPRRRAANTPPRPQARRDRKIATTASAPARVPGRRSAPRESRRERAGRPVRAGIRNRETGHAGSAPASVREARVLWRTPSRRRLRLHRKLKSCAPGGISHNAAIGKKTEPALLIRHMMARSVRPSQGTVTLTFYGLFLQPDATTADAGAAEFRISGCPDRPNCRRCYSRRKCRSHCLRRCAQCFSSHAFSAKIESMN